MTGLLFTALFTATSMAQSPDDELAPVLNLNRVLVGQDTEILLSFVSLPNGISGYEFVVTVDDPTIAGLVSVSHGLSVQTYGALLPSVTIDSADIGNIFFVGRDFPEFATIVARGIAPGTTSISVAWVRVVDNFGNPVVVPPSATRVVVE